jgi:hypothetical protein
MLRIRQLLLSLELVLSFETVFRVLFGPSNISLLISESITPGAIALTLIPLSASWSAILSVSIASLMLDLDDVKGLQAERMYKRKSVS